MTKTDTQQHSKNLVFIALLLAATALGLAAFACSDKLSLAEQVEYLNTTVSNLEHQNKKQNHFSDDLTKVALTMCEDDKFRKSEPCIRLVRIVEYNDKLEKGIVGIKLD